MFAENEVTSPARSFLMRVGPDGFLAMTLDQQLAVWGHDRRLVAWLIVTGRVRPTAELSGREQATGREGCGWHLPRVPRPVPRGRGRAGV